MSKTESKENLVPNDGGKAEEGEPIYDIGFTEEYILSETEKHFLLSAERGDLATVRRIIDENRDNPKEFNINCVDPLNRSALVAAIENENSDLITLLLQEGIKVGDALLHAISEEYVEAVEDLLQWEEQNHKEGEPYSWEAVDRSQSNFTPDITPLILAGHRNNYEILKTLLDRGASIPVPHDVKCGCDDCIKLSETDSLRYSQSRINAYRALSASSLIALSSRDPILTAFELSWELKRLQFMEAEFRAEYTEMRQNVQTFSTSLLDHARTSTELEVMLNFDHEAETEVWSPGERQTLARLKLAIKYKQKNFVAHPNVQQLLGAIWYDGLPGFRRKTMPQQIMQVLKLACMFPIYSTNYLLAPDSEMGLFMKKPFVKFIIHSASYMFFLTLLGAASQRIEHLLLELIGLPWMLEILEYWRKHERGSFPGPIECFIILYVFSLIFGELQSLYSEGLLEYICDLWNIVDFISNMFYVTWILCRTTSFIIVKRDLWYRGIDPYFPRENWHMLDPMLLAEGAFAAGMIFSFLKLVHIFSINPHLGPLQVSLGRMIIDIIKFFFIYTLVLFAFGCGLNQLLWYYSVLEKNKCYHIHPEIADFDEQEKACTIWRRFANLFETSQSLFWASFGLVDLVSFDLAGIKSFTRFWALLIFGSYSVINIIVLLNMLIAMMSNSYQIIFEKADVEWKFARSQLWMSYFEDGGTLPPPFNLCPSIKMLKKTLGKVEKKRTKSFMRKSFEKAQALHEKVMRLLVRRYVTAEQRRRDDFGITEDDIIEVRQDISTLRFELLDIFDKNKFTVPDIEKKHNAGTKKSKVMERRIVKDFQIGIVDTLVNEIKKDGEAKDVFTSLAKVMGKRGNSKKEDKKKDWNAIARQNTLKSNPIGSTRSSLIRRNQRSMRREIIQKANEGLKMDTSSLCEMNPKLSDVTQTTRVAYVKFMSKALSKREEYQVVNEKDSKDAASTSGEAASTSAAGDKNKSAAPPPPPGGAKKPDASQAVKPGGPTPPAAGGAAGKSAGGKQEAAVPPPPNQPASKAQAPTAPNAPAPTKAGDAKPAADKPAAPAPASTPAPASAPPAKPAANNPTDKPSDPKAAADKPSDKPADKPGDSKPAAGGAAAKPADKPAAGAAAKPGDKPAAKPADKKPAVKTAGQSSAAAGAAGDRGKSTVTGRMISGWL